MHELYCYAGAAPGGGGQGGTCLPIIFDVFLFFCLSAQRSVMAMIVPLPYYEICLENVLKSGKKCVGVTLL